ncbi:MAG: recombinase family protein, partial [Actinomycetes bacterium]
MREVNDRNKIRPELLARKAIVYLRQSSEKQVRENLESQRLQYSMVDRARELGWSNVEVIDCDLGSSASAGAAARVGFERLLGSVAMGEVGVVLSREMSRLSRTDRDWCRLLEVCQVFDTLLGDAERIYDPECLDDQLMLGIKGTLSVVELKVLKLRLREGMRLKARRGELIRLLPPGYVLDETGKVVKDPDERVREAMALLFRKFRETETIRQTFLWFHQEGVELPVNKARGGKTAIAWQLPTQSFVGEVLRNPFYAGAYVFGRRPTETNLVGGRLVKKSGRLRRPEECEVFLPGHHEGFLDWKGYEENQRIVRRAAIASKSDETVTVVRGGNGLLTGILRCGRCGRKLHVAYWGRSGTAARYLCKGDYDKGGRYCLSFGGSTVDRAFAKQLLGVISPFGVEASLEAADRLSSTDDDRREPLSRKLRQLEYERDRAFEQYNEVDARNRLVAAELERRWNGKLEEVERARNDIASIPPAKAPPSEEDRRRLCQLGEDFDRVWGSPDCGAELRKRIVRTVVEEIVVSAIGDGDRLSFVIHWKGGSHSSFEMEKPRSGVGQGTSLDDLDVIRRLAVRYGDDEIARVLTKLGRRTGKGKRWSEDRVATARRNHSIAGQKRSKRDPAILSLGEAAKESGASPTTIKRLVEAGILRREQVVPWAPWEIRRSDLETDPARAILDRL